MLIFSMGCLAWGLWNMRPPAGLADKAQRTDLADQLARWIAREAQAGEKGPLLILAPPPEEGDPFSSALAERAEHHMERAGFTPVTVRVVPYASGLEVSGEPISREDLEGALRAHPDSRAVLSLVGLPRLTGVPAHPGPKPRLFAASTVRMDYLETLPPGVVEFVIGVRNDSASGLPGDPSLGELGQSFTLKRWK